MLISSGAREWKHPLPTLPIVDAVLQYKNQKGFELWSLRAEVAQYQTQNYEINMKSNYEMLSVLVNCSWETS